MSTGQLQAMDRVALILGYGSCLIIADHIVAVICRTAMKVRFIYFNVYASVKVDSL